MFIEKQPKELIERYSSLLKIIGSLTRLSSEEKEIPYLYYRMAENIFCKAFLADNLSRSDVSIDAQKNDIGFGIKTFLHRNGKCYEKVAEFNKQRNLFSSFKNKELITEVSKLRNKRIATTVAIHDVEINNLIYHCITRSKGHFHIYETPIKLINTDKIKLTSNNKSDNVITFEDGFNEYSFNISKSTLFKRFNVKSLLDIESHILDDPFNMGLS